MNFEESSTDIQHLVHFEYIAESGRCTAGLAAGALEMAQIGHLQ